jgi:hypothetical protein
MVFNHRSCSIRPPIARHCIQPIQEDQSHQTQYQEAKHVYRRNKALQAVDHSGTDSGSVLPQQKRYRDDVQDVVTRYREEANKYRRIHNRFQSIIIVGSVATSAVTTASVSYGQV